MIKQLALLLCALAGPALAQNAITQEGTVLPNSPTMFRDNNRARQGATVEGAPYGQTVTTGDSVVGGRCDYSAPTDDPNGYYRLCIDAKTGTIKLDGTKLPQLDTFTIEINGQVYEFPSSVAIAGSDAVVINNIALKGVTGSIGKRLTRLGFDTIGDGGVASYNWSDSNCAVADNGAQVQPTGTGCWIADFNNVKISPAVWGGKPGVETVDSSAAINTALIYAGRVGATIDLGGYSYGICASPATIGATVNRVGMRNGKLVLQTGCASAPQSILFNSVVTNRYETGVALEDLTVDGKCTTKYVYKVSGGDHTNHRNVFIQNPAPDSVIAGSAGIYIDGGTEFTFGQSNYVTATAPCYNGGNLPLTGINHASAGNANFTGVVVVNFKTGIQGAGDDSFGPGTHVWGGCRWDATANSGFGACAWDATMRGDVGIYLNGSGHAIGVELDDPKVAGVVLNHINELDRMSAIGNVCVYGPLVEAAQTCVTVTTGTSNSLVMGTVAPQLGTASHPENIVYQQPGVAPSTTISNNPGATTFGGEAPTIRMAAVLPASPNGCIGQMGYQAGSANCVGTGWLVPGMNGCQVKSMSIGLTNAPGAGNSLKFTVQDNGFDTFMTGTASGSTNFGFNNTYVSNILPDHVITVKVETIAGTPAATQVRAIMYGCG